MRSVVQKIWHRMPLFHATQDLLDKTGYFGKASDTIWMYCSASWRVYTDFSKGEFFGDKRLRKNSEGFKENLEV